jgi:hypothetical protein
MWAGRTVQVAEHLPSKGDEAQSSNPSAAKNNKNKNKI